jgi:hypothetical protein
MTKNKFKNFSETFSDFLPILVEETLDMYEYRLKKMK